MNLDISGQNSVVPHSDIGSKGRGGNLGGRKKS